jgi:hypothetical protein
MKIDAVISGVITLRDKIDEIKKRQKEELAPLNANMLKLEAFLQSQLQLQGTTSIAAKGIGTAYLQDVVSCTVEDWQATLDWIKATEGWEFLERRVSKTVVQEYMESQGAVPPGVNVRTEVEVRVRRG